MTSREKRYFLVLVREPFLIFDINQLDLGSSEWRTGLQLIVFSLYVSDISLILFVFLGLV